MIKPQSPDEIVIFIKKAIAEEARVPDTSIDADKSFYLLGLDSISSIYILEKVENSFNVTISPLYFWDYPTIRLLAGQIFKENFQKQ